MFRLSRPSKEQVDEFLSQQQLSTLSYRYVGSSRNLRAPRGYIGDHNRVQLGSGAGTWEAAKAAVRAWKMFDIPWLQLCWPTVPIEEGANVAIVISHYGFWSLNAARIVYAVDEPRSLGFAYGTLHEHAESGEERFVVEWMEDDSVWYDLFAFSYPNAAMAKLFRPLARRLQKNFARDSKSAMLRAVARRAEEGGG